MAVIIFRAIEIPATFVPLDYLNLMDSRDLMLIGKKLSKKDSKKFSIDLLVRDQIKEDFWISCSSRSNILTIRLIKALSYQLSEELSLIK
jgi:hypothetical protein